MRSFKNRQRGFTLIELLVVLVVMGLMMGLISFSLIGGGGAELGAAQRELLGLVQQARTRAALSGMETRLIVNAVETDLEKYHRYVELVVKDTCATTNETKWLVMGQGTYLSDGVFFVPEDESFCQVRRLEGGRLYRLELCGGRLRARGRIQGGEKGWERVQIPLFCL